MLRIRHLLPFVLIMSLADSHGTELVINEVMSNPKEGGEFGFTEWSVMIISDWVEIYNPGDEPVDLRGLYLSNNCVRPDKWEIGKDMWEPMIVLPDD